MLDYIKIPKVIEKEEYEFNENLFEYKIVNKNSKYFYLLDENDIFNTYYLVNDIVLTIKKIYGDRLFCIIDVTGEDINLLFGYSNDSKLEFLIFKNFVLKNIDKEEILLIKKIELLNSIINISDKKILYFYLNEIDETITSKLFKNYNLEVIDFTSVLKKTKVHKSTIELLKPFLIGSFVFLLFYYLSNVLISRYTDSIVITNAHKQQELNIKLKKLQYVNNKYKKELRSLKLSSKNAIDLKNKIYYGDTK